MPKVFNKKCKLPKKHLYHIILTNHGRQLRHLFYTDTEPKVYKEFRRLLKESEKVVFPIKFNNEKTVIIPSQYELVIIKVKSGNESTITKVRDEYGKYTDCQTSSPDWIVLDRAQYYIEETFWVYGFHPKMQRKTFGWIVDEFIKKGIKEPYCFKNIVVYLNKLLIDTNGKLDIVFCKNKSDCTRLYNEIEKIVQKAKYKNVAMMGDVSKSKYLNLWVDKIRKRTHWNDKKIRRNSTRP